MITTEKITTTDVKRFNKNRIFRLIHYADKISRQEIADILQLSLPTVNQNLKLLLEKNLIDFVGNFESTGGRKAQAITVNGMSKCAVSVNLSDAGIKVSLVDLKGEIVFSEKKSISFTEDAVYSESIAQLVKDVISRNNVADEDVLGVGITIPGIFDNDNKTLVFSPTMGIRNYPIAEQALQRPRQVPFARLCRFAYALRVWRGTCRGILLAVERRELYVHYGAWRRHCQYSESYA